MSLQWPLKALLLSSSAFPVTAALRGQPSYSRSLSGFEKRT
jgi:hypothetical protein